MEAGINSARDFIYIETLGFTPTLMQQQLALALGDSNRTTLDNAVFSRRQRGRDAFYALRLCHRRLE